MYSPAPNGRPAVRHELDIRSIVLLSSLHVKPDDTFQILVGYYSLVQFYWVGWGVLRTTLGEAGLPTTAAPRLYNTNDTRIHFHFHPNTPSPPHPLSSTTEMADDDDLADLDIDGVLKVPEIILLGERLTACFLAVADMSEALENSDSMTTRVKKRLGKEMAIVEEEVCRRPPSRVCVVGG